MPFDLERAAKALAHAHADVTLFRPALLDLLFATGTAVGEAAVALEVGDALAIRASGPSAPSLLPPRVVVAIDIEPPHLSSVRAALGPARWPAPLASLGGPDVVIAWVAALRAMAASSSLRPWRALYFRGPAAGLAAYVEAELADLEPDADVVQIVPSVTASVDEPAIAAGSDLLTLSVTRPRNVWRFPACEHTYALIGHHPWGQGLPALCRLLGAFEANTAWALHDIHHYFGERGHLSAVLRTARPIDVTAFGFTARNVDAGSRLMFPINDALAAVTSIAGRMGKGWGPSLMAPLHLHALPDGLHLDLMVPPGEAPKLPDRQGTLALQWERKPLIARSPVAVMPLAVGADETMGPLAAGVPHPIVTAWQVPAGLRTDIAALQRALDGAIASAS